ncbi:hypothetical protein [Aporhodopirellula aestuarii]|uniref:Uncharacterized protein n=1 Tax=Aporhodopirellula aestuarii TaxID=2950107 RepID=A0ABT0U3E4_9BACT|nr:hypothetical protein [Aporhodopirellula aestuarii]MCM2370973.1 hypothetical protein [Aporhodopirellula aestuarii]
MNGIHHSSQQISHQEFGKKQSTCLNDDAAKTINDTRSRGTSIVLVLFSAERRKPSGPALPDGLRRSATFEIPQ